MGDPVQKIIHKFVEYIPDVLDDGVLYIAIEYGTVIHKCCCGCGEEVATPLTPTDWRLIFNGETISIYPSIGNWDYKCKSHYFILKNRIIWANQWTKEKIQNGREFDRYQKRLFYTGESYGLSLDIEDDDLKNNDN